MSNILHKKGDICIIKATLEQLEDIGIDRDIRNMEAIFLQDFPTGYFEIMVKPPEHILKFFDGEEYYEHYDIPMHWLTFKNE